MGLVVVEVNGVTSFKSLVGVVMVVVVVVVMAVMVVVKARGVIFCLERKGERKGENQKIKETWPFFLLNIA